MPIVIDEVLITVEVENQAAVPPQAGAPQAATDKQALVAECVERVLAILDERKEP